MVARAEVVADLRAESDDLDRLVAQLRPERWAAPTPSPGWTVASQIAHLAWTDAVALQAVTEPAAFRATAADFDRRGTDAVDEAAATGAARAPAELLAGWR